MCSSQRHNFYTYQHALIKEKGEKLLGNYRLRNLIMCMAYGIIMRVGKWEEIGRERERKGGRKGGRERKRKGGREEGEGTYFCCISLWLATSSRSLELSDSFFNCKSIIVLF